MSDEWGPWIEHDGTPAPDAQGRYCNVISADGRDECGVVRAAVAVPNRRSLWIWGTLDDWEMEQRVIRYRIRKPHGLTILEGLLENLPEEVPA